MSEVVAALDKASIGRPNGYADRMMIRLGAEFNAELERGRAIEAGMRPPDKEPFLEPRDTRKMETNPS